jgi:hypothetical protein
MSADFLVELLKTGAALKLAGKVDLSIDRVPDIWAQYMDSKGWHEQFRKEPTSMPLSATS